MVIVSAYGGSDLRFDTWIVGVEDEHADNLITTTVLQSLNCDALEDNLDIDLTFC